MDCDISIQHCSIKIETDTLPTAADANPFDEHDVEDHEHEEISEDYKFSIHEYTTDYHIKLPNPDFLEFPDSCKSRTKSARRLKHEIPVEHRCTTCSNWFSRKSNLLRHMHKVHGIVMPVMQSTTRRKKVKRQVRSVAYCEFCPCKYLSQKRLMLHLQTYHAADTGQPCFKSGAVNIGAKTGKRAYRCVLCSVQTTTRTNLNRHIENIHLKNAVPLSARTCATCHKVFSSVQVLDTHMSGVHASSTDYICAACGAGFKRKAYLRLHELRIHAANGAECDVCGRPCGTKDALKKHKESHNQKTAHVCEECETVCWSRGALLYHRARHHRGQPLRKRPKIVRTSADVRPYKCADCGRQCFSIKLLKTHLKTHIRPHKCEFCGKTYGSAYDARLHFQNHHEAPKAPPTIECPICAKLFFSLSTMRSHAVSHQSETQRKYECEICGKRCKRGSDVKTHALSHQSDADKKFECAVCKKKFARRQYLKKHKCASFCDSD